MKATELMIEDWVKWEYISYPNVVRNNGYKQVAAIHGDDSVDLMDEDTLFEQVPMDEVKAVELTAKILENNYEEVCRHLGHAYEWTWRGENGYVELSESVFDQICPYGYFLTVDGGKDYTMRIRYVHELQHLLRLAGVNNEITL